MNLQTIGLEDESVFTLEKDEVDSRKERQEEGIRDRFVYGLLRITTNNISGIFFCS